MRIGGLASGIDTDTIIKDLMKAERLPLDKMEQDKTKLEWQRDRFREINTKVKELKDLTSGINSMQGSKMYNTKKVSSSDEGVVTATGNTSALEGSYKVEVHQLASTAINVSNKVRIDPDEKLIGQTVDEFNYSIADNETFSFITYNENGEAKTHEYEIEADDTLSDVLKKVNNDPDNNVRMFYDDNTERVVMETTRTGNYNPNGEEIVFGTDTNSFFKYALNMHQSNENGGQNAKFTYNDGYVVETTENTYTLNHITFEFNGINEGNPATLKVTTDTDAIKGKITEFVDKYNELIEMLNDSQREERHRDYPPLTEAQKEEMDEKEIELWEEKAKSGILRGDSIISSGMFSLRQNWYEKMETGSSFKLLTDIGISTTKDYLDGGKLEIDEGELDDAINADPNGIYKLFAGDSDTNTLGIMDHLNNSLSTIEEQINQRAGRTWDQEKSYTLGKNIDDIQNRMEAFQDRLTQTEDRYWRQFGAMEEAISMMNQQSAMLMSNFGGQ
ncbi:flagellar hook-associated protein 2 [Oceanobacillus halophilus]|uniref:Flagellar hook-associated protein 2 n=2 Tax=Oceanobacillus halophilus TaxID=930130 RepID=A0A495A7W3_9BACI|nr:flagellar hook-associated protein 2 [Oceanobacillus halophilus]